MEGIDRNFATGSVEAADPYDQYLDSIGYYRKHTARDASCLFRVISEQIYGAQVYHPDIREICIRYMELNRSTYEKLVVTNLDFDEHLMKMSHSRTPGTLAELHALAYRFKRNVLLFDAFSTGNWYVSEPEFSDTLLVFYVPQKHFDSIYTKSYMESIAFCQSLTYEILYSHVFKLPDVIYAVERMLHDTNEDTYVSYIGVSPYDNSQESLTLSDGRHFILDHADETECILDNYLLCHFHNIQFDRIKMQLHREVLDDPDACDQVDRLFSALLPRRDVSCVRQLLDENITPFSYKVAKALDSHIYRNIEFDVWNEARKTAKFKEWRNHYTNLQVGVKCLVDNILWNQESSFTGHIQEMYPRKGTCEVYIEKLGSRTVPLSSVTTFPNTSWKTHPYEKREIREAVTGEPYNKKKTNNFNSNEEKIEQAVHYLAKPLHMEQQYCEYIACPQYNYNRPTKNDDTAKGTNSSSNKNVSNKKNAAATESKPPIKVVEPPKVEYESHRHSRSQIHVATTNSNWNAGNQQNYSNIQSSSGYARRTDVEYNFQGNSIASMIKRKDLLPSMHQINVNVQESCDVNGRDLPYNDVRTLRFFYNLGIDFLRFLHEIFPAKTISTFFNPVESPTPRGRYHYYDNSNECADLAAEFHRSAQISCQDQYAKTTDVGQQHQRPYSGANTPVASKRYSKNYRYEYNKSNRTFAEDTTKYTPNHSKTSAEHTVTSSKVGANTWSQTDGEIAPQYVQPSPTSAAMQQFYPCYPAEIPDSANMYLCGYYPPMNENMYPYEMLPSGMGLTEPDEMELAQTYPYYSQQEMYYYPQPFQPMALPPQQGGCWYPQQVPITIPTTMATPIPTTSYGQYTVLGPNDNPGTNDTNTTSVPFTPNEPLINTEVKRKLR